MLKKIPLQHVKSKEDIHNLTAIWNTLTLLLSSKANSSHIKLEIKKKNQQAIIWVFGISSWNDQRREDGDHYYLKWPKIYFTLGLPLLSLGFYTAVNLC